MKWLRRFGAYLAAVLVTGLLGSVLQTQLNLARLQALGVEVGFSERLGVTLRDFVGFAPLFTGLVAGGFLIAFLCTGALRRWLIARRSALYALAGAVAVTTILLAMRAALGLDAIAAARDTLGFLGLAACGAVGGVVFSALQPPGSSASDSSPLRGAPGSK